MPKNSQTEKTQIALLSNDIAYIKVKMDEINKKMDNLPIQFVSQTEFKPIKTIVYGLISLILVSFVGALLSLIIRK